MDRSNSSSSETTESASSSSSSSSSSGGEHGTLASSVTSNNSKRAPLATAATNSEMETHDPPRKKPKLNQDPSRLPSSSDARSPPRKPIGTPLRSSRGLGHTSRGAASGSLFKPFKSPLARNEKSGSKAVPSPSSSTGQSLPPSTPTRNRVYPASPTKPSALVPLRTRKLSEREALQERLRILRQADKIEREKSLDVLPLLISKWREAGRLASQDLWNLTGAAEAGEQAFTVRTERYDDDDEADRRRHGDEDGGYEEPDVTEIGHYQRIAAPTTDACRPLSPLSRMLARRTVSDGTREQAVALKGVDDDDHLRHQDGRVGDNVSSRGSSPPPPSELFGSGKSGYRIPRVNGKQSQPSSGSLIGTTSREEQTWIDSVRDAEEAEKRGKGIEQKWNVGRMLDLIGVDKTTLCWNPDEEDFDA